MIVVSNTTPIISLASIQKIAILEQLFGEIIVPQAVYGEIKAKESWGYKEIDLEFIRVETVVREHVEWDSIPFKWWH